MVEVAVVAEALRSYAGQVVPPFNVYRIIEARWPDAVITGRDLPDGIEEILCLAKDRILIVYARSLSTADRRFAIAHAIGHLVFDADECRHCGRVVVDPAREIRADDFARELLVPDRALLNRVVMWPPEDDGDHDFYLDQVDMIASGFHVPPHLIDQRIRLLRTPARM